jgi:hypothetical protein
MHEQAIPHCRTWHNGEGASTTGGGMNAILHGMNVPGLRMKKSGIFIRFSILILLKPGNPSLLIAIFTIDKKY